jgi:hypothetical protein
MEDKARSAPWRLALLLAGDLALAGASAFLSLVLAIALSSGKGAGATGDIMMALLALLAGAFLLLLLPVFLLARRWSGSTGAALGLAAAAGLAHAALWAATLFTMAVVLNR